MKNAILGLLAVSVVTVSAQAQQSYFCEAQNLPPVKQALKKALKRVQERNGMTATPKLLNGGRPTVIDSGGMGDALDYWGDQILLFQVDGEEGRVLHERAIVIKLKYNALVHSEDSGLDVVCADTGVRLPQFSYVLDPSAGTTEAILLTP